MLINNITKDGEGVKKMKLYTKGFTLMELMIVIIIIAILVTIATPLYFKAVERSRMAEAINNLGAIRQSEYRFFAQHANITRELNLLDVGDPEANVAPGQTIRYINYAIAGGTIGNMQYGCERDRTAQYPGFGVPADGYNVLMDANGNITTQPPF